jgi:hypothetical protein
MILLNGGCLQKSNSSLTIAGVAVFVAGHGSSQLQQRRCNRLQVSLLAVLKGVAGAISAVCKSVFLWWWDRRVRGGGEHF